MGCIASENLRHRIRIQKKVRSITERGFTEERWEDVCSVWAAVDTLRGREFYAAAAVQAERTVKFTIRFREDILEGMRILFQGVAYEVLHLANLSYRNQYIEIRARDTSSLGGVEYVD